MANSWDAQQALLRLQFDNAGYESVSRSLPACHFMCHFFFILREGTDMFVCLDNDNNRCLLHKYEAVWWCINV